MLQRNVGPSSGFGAGHGAGQATAAGFGAGHGTSLSTAAGFDAGQATAAGLGG